MLRQRRHLRSGAVVSRTRKIVAAATILIVGLLLAWPMRKTGGDSGHLTTSSPTAGLPAKPLLEIGPPFSQPDSPPASMASLTTGAMTPARPTDVATTPANSTDSANVVVPVEPHGAGLPGDAPAVDSEVRVHVVHNGDTLERLAKRYLGSESRALEIFDFNRDVLSNPHLLPIGAELRLPARRKSSE